MPREYTRAVLHVSRDARLVAGVGGAVAYFADRAGLEGGARESLVSELEEFCRQSLPRLEVAGDTLDVAIADFADRIEIVVEHRGEGRSCSAAKCVPTADRVQYDVENGTMRTTLVKFVRPHRNDS